jgi:putative zinc finger/helix-turn-helix YgiT family protein
MKCKESTHHYKESGLDYVYLKGIEIFYCDCGEKIVSIPAVTELHSTIGRFLLKKKSLLNGKEIKFLRKNMGLTAKKLADCLGVNNASISRWENNKIIITKPHDLLLRVVYASIKGIPNDEIKNIIEVDFKKIQPKQKKTTKRTISRDQWSKSQTVCLSA